MRVIEMTRNFVFEQAYKEFSAVIVVRSRDKYAGFKFRLSRSVATVRSPHVLNPNFQHQEGFAKDRIHTFLSLHLHHHPRLVTLTSHARKIGY
jgi:hypothetical protein